MALIDRIKYDAPSDHWLVWKYGSDAVRLGAQLIVNESQEALFVKSGQVLDLFGPGTHTLSTGNLPLFSKAVNLPFGGETPFSAEVWFVNKTAKRDLRWGTRSPIQVVDPVYRFPVNVRAFGQWGIRVENTRSLLAQLVGTLKHLTSERIDSYFVGEIVQRLSDMIAKLFIAEGVSIFEANARLNQLSAAAAEAIRAEFSRFGLEIVNFNVERISMPDEDMKKFQDVLGKKMEMEQLGRAQVGPGYTAMRSFDILEKAASAPGGAAGALMAGGLGLGIGIGGGIPAGRELAQAMQPGAGVTMHTPNAVGTAPSPTGTMPTAGSGAAPGTAAAAVPFTATNGGAHSPAPGPGAAPNAGGPAVSTAAVAPVNPSAAAAAGTSTTASSVPLDFVARLQQLKALLDAGLITQNEFDAKKTQILASL